MASEGFSTLTGVAVKLVRTLTPICTGLGLALVDLQLTERACVARGAGAGVTVLSIYTYGIMQTVVTIFTFIDVNLDIRQSHFLS